MNYLRYTHVVFMIIVWAYIFVFIKPNRIKDLLPIGIIALIVIFIIEEFVISLKLYQFNKPLINVLGTPFFNLIWGAGSGIVFMNYMKKEFLKQIPIVLFFALLTLGFEYIAEIAGVASHHGNYKEIHQFFIDFLALLLVKWISIGIFGNRLFKNQITSL